jgi:ABC-type phosphate/phosphonate transport system permease subunit
MMNDPMPPVTEGLGLVMSLGIFFLLVCVSAIFLHIGTGLARVQHRSFGKAILGTLVCSIIGSVLGTVLSILGVVLALLINPLLVKGIYATTYGKAFLAYLLSIAVSMTVGVLVILILGLMGYTGAVAPGGG